MKLKTKIFIGLTLYLLTSDYYSSEQNHEQEVTLKKEQEKKEIQDLFNEIWVLVNMITNNKYEYKYEYNDGLLSIGINDKRNTYVKLLRVSNTSYCDIIIWNDGGIDFYDTNGNLYKKYNLFTGKNIPIIPQEEKELLQETLTHEYRKAILEKLKGNLQSKHKEIENIKTLFGDIITELKKNIEANIEDGWKIDNDKIVLENDKSMIMICHAFDIIFFDKDNSKLYKGINCFGQVTYINNNIKNIKNIHEDIEKLLTEKGGYIKEYIINLLKIEEKTVDFTTRTEVLNSIINKLRNTNNNEKLINAESEVSQGSEILSLGLVIEEGGSEEGSVAGGKTGGGPVKGKGGSVEEGSELAGEESESEEEQEAGGGPAGGEVLGEVGESRSVAGGTRGGESVSQGPAGSAELGSEEGLKAPTEKSKSTSKTWIIGIVVLSLAFLSLWRYGISRKEKKNDKKKDDEKVKTEKDSTIENGVNIEKNITVKT